MKKSLLATVLATALLAAPAHASLIFFGEDLGRGENTKLSNWENAQNAEAEFLSYLIDAGTENFESFREGKKSPLELDFGIAGTATLHGDGEIDRLARNENTNGVGRYAVSGSQFWEADNSFRIDFSNPVAAFGFYGVDIGDFNGQITITTNNGDVFNIGNSTNTKGGGVLFWGIIDVLNPFTSLTFGNTKPGVDFFAFDNMTIGSIAQVTGVDAGDIIDTPVSSQVSAPASIALFGLSLLGLGAIRRKTK